jgi:hypothetical protein
MEIIVEIWVGTKIYSIEAATMIRMKNKRKVCWLKIYIYMYFQDKNTTKTISIKGNKESWQLYSVIQSKLLTDINRTVIQSKLPTDINRTVIQSKLLTDINRTVIQSKLLTDINRTVIQSKLLTDINRTVGIIFNELGIQCSYSRIQLLIPSSWRHRKTRNVNFWYIWCLFLLEDPYIYINWLFVVQVLPYQ